MEPSEVDLKLDSLISGDVSDLHSSHNVIGLSDHLYKREILNSFPW